MNKYDEMVVRITIFCREPLNFGLLEKCKKIVKKVMSDQIIVNPVKEHRLRKILITHSLYCDLYFGNG